MTWTVDLKTHIHKKYGVDLEIKKSCQQRYGFKNRAAFHFARIDEKQPFNAWRMGRILERMLSERIDKNDCYKIRVEWLETFVYFNDLDAVLDAVPENLLPNLRSIEMADPRLTSYKKSNADDYPVEIVLSKRLPHAQYGYRVHCVSSGKIRGRVGEQNLQGLANAIKSYDGIKTTNMFEYYSNKARAVPNHYFYCKSLEWLPIILMTEPNYIKRIDKFITTKELENETTDQDTN